MYRKAGLHANIDSGVSERATRGLGQVYAGCLKGEEGGAVSLSQCRCMCCAAAVHTLTLKFVLVLQPVLTAGTCAAAWPQGDPFLGGGLSIVAYLILRFLFKAFIVVRQRFLNKARSGPLPFPPHCI